MRPPPKCKVCGEDEHLTILSQTETHVKLGCLNCEIMKEDDIYKNYYKLKLENDALKNTIIQLKEDALEDAETRRIINDANDELKNETIFLNTELSMAKNSISKLYEDYDEAIRIRNVWYDSYMNCKNDFQTKVDDIKNFLDNMAKEEFKKYRETSNGSKLK